jgi:hypothetical protein
MPRDNTNCAAPSWYDKLTDQRLGERSGAIRARGFHRILKLARTIADLAGSERIETVHLAEAKDPLAEAWKRLLEAGARGFLVSPDLEW